ncbi:3-methylfumaryl-CoA hydratase [Loktanella ponticola]|uniref:3-methylfumaryl-CoA hydratase n=1 Tax=Yoonia ponticola TaxID=1524255 RepID=A0A7W9BLU2_9RHOB|nr:acyl dehydratase [Yoonia ponticola]MBB5722899.1 3-methylfumaryl-CoA hydratase [Yoonia ponticola]
MHSKPYQTQSTIDILDPTRAQALQATLGQEPTIQSGDALPPFAHHIYFWDAKTPDVLGADGHPATGSFIPDLGLPKRMWAAGRIVQHQPLKAGIKAEKISTVEGVTRKDGQSGQLAFVRVRHDIKQRHALAVTEWQELVYRPADAPTAAPKPAPTVAAHSEPLNFTSTQLFRYSALTFNGHRIHYDADYARDVEGYAGLVVHGPLLAHLMMQLATTLYGGLTDFSYRGASPLIAGEAATLCASDGHFWVRGEDGRLCSSGQIAAA